MKNIVILVADSLRYDSVPERIQEDAASDVIPTLAPSLHTPTSFTSMFTGLSPEHHNIRGFFDDLGDGIQTAFDRFDNASFYDGEDSALNRHVFRSDGRDLHEMEPPFLWIERALETHLPYGKIRHEQDFDFEASGWEYIEKLEAGEIDVEREYQEGVETLEEHFFRHVEELEEQGILDETLVILTSDHGELLGERFLWKKRYEHNYPPIRPLVEVPTVFYNAEVDAECMRLIDIIPTALGILGRDAGLGDGVDVRKEPVREGRNVMEDVKAGFDTTWRFNGEHWSPTLPSRMQIIAKTLMGDVKRFGYRKGYRPLEEKLEDKREEELEGVEI